MKYEGSNEFQQAIKLETTRLRLDKLKHFAKTGEKDILAKSIASINCTLPNIINKLSDIEFDMFTELRLTL